MDLKPLLMIFDGELVLGIMVYSRLTIGLVMVLYDNELLLIFLRNYYKLRLVFLDDGVWDTTCLLACLSENIVKLITDIYVGFNGSGVDICI